MSAKFAIGLDYGTNSVRALVVNTATGEEIGTAVWNYEHGQAGIVIDQNDPNLARQHPADYLKGLQVAVQEALHSAASHSDFNPAQVIGIGVDTTGSTPLPVNHEGRPLAFDEKFHTNPDAMAWLWKDHTAHAEAEQITALAARMHPEYLAKCGGKYSSEWFWSKVLRCQKVAPAVYDAAYTWVEMADYIPAALTGTTHPTQLKRCICAAGHKAMFHPDWGGYPEMDFLKQLDPALEKLRKTLPGQACHVGQAVGQLTDEWSTKLGLPSGIPVAAGAFDAHLGAVGCGITPGVFVKILGTSCCDMMVAPLAMDLPDIPGLCGIVPSSILPDAYGLEAGQSAFGDLYNWFVNYIQPGGPEAGDHAALTAQAERIKPGATGLVGLDWHNGNRTILVDQRLTGMIMGLTLHTTPAEIYRCLIESAAFGARVIMERFEEYGVKIERVVNCGGISVKNPMVMQILADATGRTMEVSRSEQTCALGAAMAGAVVAGAAAGGHTDFAEAAAAMTAVREHKFVPVKENVAVYDRLYAIYRRLHDAFGIEGQAGSDMSDIMKSLLAIRDEVRGA